MAQGIARSSRCSADRNPDQRLELGNPGDHRNLKGGVSELKIDFGPGYRVYYTERNGEIIILLCGGDKKSQQDDIAQAIAMIGDLED